MCTLQCLSRWGAGTCVQAFKSAVGRSYRVIDRLDVVPSLPPFQGYVQLDYPMWIQVCMSVWDAACGHLGPAGRPCPHGPCYL